VVQAVVAVVLLVVVVRLPLGAQVQPIKVLLVAQAIMHNTVLVVVVVLVQLVAMQLLQLVVQAETA
jgi:hypothetical protein